MRDMGLQGVIRGKPIKTTVSDKAAPCPRDHVNRQFKAPRPNVLWLSDFSYVATWTGFVYVAFVIDAYARRIVGWRASRTAHAGFVLDALEQALRDRRPVHRAGLVHHSDRGQPIRLDQIHRAPGRSLVASGLPRAVPWRGRGAKFRPPGRSPRSCGTPRQDGSLSRHPDHEASCEAYPAHNPSYRRRGAAVREPQDRQNRYRFRASRRN
ncbi:transposase InsO family protein [Bradyrhizobium sp. AZCC 2262]